MLPNSSVALVPGPDEEVQIVREILRLFVNDQKTEKQNPRTRDKTKFQAIVGSLKAIGLKRPITVSRREPDPDGTCFDLVCRQGRMEAFLALGQNTIPALVNDAPRQEQLLMSLAENIARRPPSNRGLPRELRNLRERDYQPEEIARKLGLDRAYIYGILHLLEKGEEVLISAVESGRIPISIAINIASGNDHELQQLQLALSEAYEKGDLRGAKLLSAKRPTCAHVDLRFGAA